VRNAVENGYFWVRLILLFLALHPWSWVIWNCWTTEFDDNVIATQFRSKRNQSSISPNAYYIFVNLSQYWVVSVSCLWLLRFLSIEAVHNLFVNAFCDEDGSGILYWFNQEKKLLGFESLRMRFWSRCFHRNWKRKMRATTCTSRWSQESLDHLQDINVNTQSISLSRRLQHLYDTSNNLHLSMDSCFTLATVKLQSY